MKPKLSILEQLDLFAMRNIRLEEELITLEKNDGMELGRIETLEKKEIVDPELFEFDIRKSAIKTTEHFHLYFCIENTIRRMIKQTMTEKYGPNWWDLAKVPEGVKNNVRDNIKREIDSVMTSRSKDDPLAYTTLGELSQIILENWDDFADQLRSKKAVSSILFQLNQIRVAVAHSNELSEHDSNRLEILIKDWQYQQG
jgi:hypothetical protein